MFQQSGFVTCRGLMVLTYQIHRLSGSRAIGACQSFDLL